MEQPDGLLVGLQEHAFEKNYFIFENDVFF